MNAVCWEYCQGVYFWGCCARTHCPGYSTPSRTTAPAAACLRIPPTCRDATWSWDSPAAVQLVGFLTPMMQFEGVRRLLLLGSPFSSYLNVMERRYTVLGLPCLWSQQHVSSERTFRRRFQSGGWLNDTLGNTAVCTVPERPNDDTNDAGRQPCGRQLHTCDGGPTNHTSPTRGSEQQASPVANTAVSPSSAVTPKPSLPLCSLRSAVWWHFYGATMRSIYARYCCRDSVCLSIRPSICPSVKCMYCDKTKAPSEKSSIMTNRKSPTGFRLVPKLVTLNDLEWRNDKKVRGLSDL